MTPSSTPDTVLDDFPEAPDVSHLVTEDDTPVDNLGSEKQQRLLTEPLYTAWRPVDESGAPEPFFATANAGFYASLRETAIVPDVMLARGVAAPADHWAKQHRAWLLWVVGKKPDVVIEIVSNRVGDGLGRKRRKYAEIGIVWYAVWDPAGRLAVVGPSGEPSRLQVLELHGGRYVPSDGMAAVLGLTLVEWNGTFEGGPGPWIRWAYPDGTLVPTGAELAQVARERAESERERADTERERAESERAKRVAAEADVEALRARLRALGVEP